MKFHLALHTPIKQGAYNTPDPLPLLAIRRSLFAARFARAIYRLPLSKILCPHTYYAAAHAYDRAIKTGHCSIL